jgi:hypothetical protein
VEASILYPRATGATASWNPTLGAVTVTLPRTPAACVLSLTT